MRFPPRTPEIVQSRRQDIAMPRCDFRVQWKSLAITISSCDFWAENSSFCENFSDLALTMLNSKQWSLVLLCTKRMPGCPIGFISWGPHPIPLPSSGAWTTIASLKVPMRVSSHGRSEKNWPHHTRGRNPANPLPLAHMLDRRWMCLATLQRHTARRPSKKVRARTHVRSSGLRSPWPTAGIRKSWTPKLLGKLKNDSPEPDPKFLLKLQNYKNTQKLYFGACNN